MKRAKELPFKRQTKYVVERKIDGVKTFLWVDDSGAVFEPDNGVDNRVASVIDSKEFVLEGYVVDDTFYACDVLYYAGRDLRSEPWPERYKVLKNEFWWNSAVKINRPLVVTDKSEMAEAIALFEMLDHSEGVVVREYDSVYSDDKMFLPSKEAEV